MIYIRHRINDLSGISNVAKNHGAEIDIRTVGVPVASELVVTHDPFTSGAPLTEWLKKWKAHGATGPVIFNTKEDGLEEKIRECAISTGVENFFFLDTALPTLIRLTMWGNEPRFAVRQSAYEPLSSCIAFAGKADWVWVDCVKGVFVSTSDVEKLKKHFRVCLVSPELWNVDWAPNAQSRELKRLADAICTKVPEKWENQ